MHNVLLMHEGDALQDLLHVVHAGALRVLKIVIHNALKELPACDAAAIQTTVAGYYTALL